MPTMLFSGILVADALLDDEECAAIRRIAEAHLEPSSTYVGGEQHTSDTSSTTETRTSWNAWVYAPKESPPPGSDEALLVAVQERVASLIRQPSVVAEAMQVVRYTAGQHYHYHLDAGDETNPSKGRFVTALFYLNDDLDGGATNFPTASNTSCSGSAPPPNRNVYSVRERYDYCQVKEGVTVTPRRGRVAIFYNTLPVGRPNKASHVIQKHTLVTVITDV